MPKTKRTNARKNDTGKLRIGDHWNAITIIALSQSNPLKAVAEFVENSIDAGAGQVTIVRGREKGQAYLRITDDGRGVPADEEGNPDFKYVATHICDSIKRHLQQEARQGIQGEFGIGLLSFWTVGEQLTLACPGADGKLHQMRMQKGEPGYEISKRRQLVASPGTELTIKPLLPGIRNFTGEKLQWYLASELRDRIRNSNVTIRIIDRLSRAEYLVEPRQFTGRLLRDLPAVTTPHGEVYIELYLSEPDPAHHIGLYRTGTRVLESIDAVDELARSPWSSHYLQGIVDAPFLNLTPGTRLGVLRDAVYADFCDALGPLETALEELLVRQRQAEEEQANRQTLRSIQRAFREALLTLPEEEYDWFDIRDRNGKSLRPRPSGPAAAALADAPENAAAASPESSPAEPAAEPKQKEFFEHPGPLHQLRVAPAVCVVPVEKSRTLRAVARDRNGRQVDQGLTFQWRIEEGGGQLQDADREIVTFQAPAEPGLTRVVVEAVQHEIHCTAEAVVTVTDSLVPQPDAARDRQGLPGYTFQKAAGQLWRSRYDKTQNVIVINSGHRDFVYAARNRPLKLRYICRLFSKELVFHNFPGYTAQQLLERMIELSLYTEEHLR